MNRILTAAALMAATSCGAAVRNGSGPVFLSMDSISGFSGAAKAATGASVLFSDVITNVTSGGVCSSASPCPTVFADTGGVTLRLVPKDVTLTAAPSTNNEVTITRVHIAYRRTDNRGVQGVDVPFAFDSVANITVPATSPVQLNFELVRIQAKTESPLVQLKTNGQTIAVIGDVTVYGQDRTGNTVSASGSIQVEFANFGDN